MPAAKSVSSVELECGGVVGQKAFCEYTTFLLGLSSGDESGVLAADTGEGREWEAGKLDARLPVTQPNDPPRPCGLSGGHFC